MDPLSVLAAVTSAIRIAQAAVQLGQDAAPYVTAIYDGLVNKVDVTQADLDALEAKIDALSNELQQPLPPEV